MKSTINQRVVESIKYLLDAGVIKSQRKLAERINESPTKINEIIKDKSNADTELIHKLFQEFSLNPMYIIAGLGKRFLESNLLDNNETNDQQTSCLNIYDSYENQQKLIKMYEDKIAQLEAQLSKTTAEQL